MLIQVGLGVGPAQSQILDALEAITRIEISDFSRDRVLFDAGQAVGRNLANVPIFGTATPGIAVEARIVGDDGSRTDWVALGSADVDGVWSGVLPSARRSDWLRVEVRNRDEPAANAMTVNRFGVGHVIALWGQSEIVRLRTTFFDSLTPEPLLDEDAVQAMWMGDAPVVKHLTDADPQSTALAAMANVLMSERPGDKFAIVFQAVSGTGFTSLVDDDNPERSWADDAALHAFATADGQHVGLPAISWFAAPGSLADSYGEAVLPLFTGKTMAGADVSFPTTLTFGSGRSLKADHWFGELYDPAHTRWIGYGPHRFDVTADMRSATVLAGGNTQVSLANKQAARLAWRDMLANPIAADTFLPAGLEPLTYRNGFSDGADGWTDIPHPAGDHDDGAAQLARLTAHAILQASGLSDWDLPRFDSAIWEPAGAYVDFSSSAGPITTTRRARVEPALDDSFAHWTDVVGWQINGAPANRAEIVDGVVRLYPNSDVFTASDVVSFGEGGATGMAKFPQDAIAELYKDMPIVDVGAARVAGVPVRSMPDESVLQNGLASDETSFTSNASGPYFQDPNAIGNGVSQLQATLHFRPDVQTGGARTIVGLSGNNIRLEVLPGGRLRLTVRDSGGTIFANALSIPNALGDGISADLTFALDLDAGFARIWINDVMVLDRAFVANTGVLSSVRKLSVLAQFGGLTQMQSQTSAIRVWLDAEPDNTSPVSAPYKEIEGQLIDVNADPWKQGADAT